MNKNSVLSIYEQLLRKRSLFFKIVSPILKVSALWYAGDRVLCPCCEQQFRTFLPFGANKRPNALCPGCLSLERHRLMWLYLQNKTSLLSEQLKVLHIAPEYWLQRRLKTVPNLTYWTADIQPGEAMLQMDITKIDYPDSSFDVILCSHVLEHIPDDTQAMRELCRVLKPGGWAILQVPLDRDREETVEGTRDLTLKERRQRFGHHDHVRMYGQDYQTKLEQAGFSVFVDRYPEELGINQIEYYGLMPSEDIYLCTLSRRKARNCGFRATSISFIKDARPFV
ncbi:methyltransferase domain-containing protein [Roseofilum sp. Belize Diploria]|uniref:methyltransferase domain-containing protein n=1 Tax=Roseofilum sp. Belize Diploria TaxID=2821501 RepID=UPI001B1BF8DC|nr:methyltransferase domain-containing protein [Roseofilum sp. Belize Diploria]MBP0006876.1 methyltransferase domain-containing protein [Roseofilum sp. Belize Diploria]